MTAKLPITSLGTLKGKTGGIFIQFSSYIGIRLVLSTSIDAWLGCGCLSRKIRAYQKSQAVVIVNRLFQVTETYLCIPLSLSSRLLLLSLLRSCSRCHLLQALSNQFFTYTINSLKGRRGYKYRPRPR